MKSKLLLFGLGLLILFSLFMLAFIFILSFLNIFVSFEKLSFMIAFWVAFGVGAFCALICFYYINTKSKSAKINILRHWLSQNYPKVILFYLVLVIIFVSIKSEIIWSFDSLKDIISLEWAIFGISIAIFIVWNVIILKYLKDTKPIKSNRDCSIFDLEYINKKEEFYPEASAFFNSVSLLILNVIVLISATASAFLGNEEVTLFNQNIVIISFYLTTNTVLELLLDVIKPLKIEKKALLGETKVTADDIKEKEKIETNILNASRLIKEIDRFESIDKEQKEKMKTEIVVKALGIEDIFNNKESE